jgi:hypothetical protein
MRLKAPLRKVFDRERVPRVATIGRDGVPHVVPVCHVLEDSKVYFAADKDSKKVKNLRAHSQAAVEGGPVFGRLAASGRRRRHGSGDVHRSGTAFPEASEFLYQKYHQYAGESALEEGEVVMVEVIPRQLVSWGLD